MVEFINLKIFLIQLKICFSEGKCLTHAKLSSPLTASPKAAEWLLLGGNQEVLL